MAVDEALLEASLERGEAFVRWYRWSEATISLGYFQSAQAAATGSPRFAELPIVRRLTGGGAILHHHELTYSCVVPPAHPLAQSPHALYEGVHERIGDVLGRHGIVARMRGTALRREDEPFLCFGRADARDVVLGANKVLGSAQRRRRGAVLQHGSLVLRRSPFAPEFPGILDLCPSATFGLAQLAELATELASLLGGRACIATLTEIDRLRAVGMEQDRYRRVDWRTVGSPRGKPA
jgi:lipoate-protein ligase A